MSDATASPQERRRDLAGTILAVLVALVGGYVVFATRHMSPMGAVFPRTIAVIMIIAALALLARTLFRATAPAGSDAPAGSAARRIAVGVLILGWALAFPVIGFVTTGIVAFLAILAVANHDPWQPRRTALYVATAVVVVLVAYLLLTSILNVPVPRGMLI